MVSYVLPLGMVEVREYLDRGGSSPYAAWSDRLNREALARIQQGNFSNAKSVGAGVYEYRIDFGPGYRIYFGKDGDRLVILVGGGTKSVSRKTSPRHWLGGRTTSNEKVQEGDYNGSDTRFQQRHSWLYQTERRYPSLSEKSDADARSPWQPSSSQLVRDRCLFAASGRRALRSPIRVCRLSREAAATLSGNKTRCFCRLKSLTEQGRFARKNPPGFPDCTRSVSLSEAERQGAGIVSESPTICPESRKLRLHCFSYACALGFSLGPNRRLSELSYKNGHLVQP